MVCKHTPRMDRSSVRGTLAVNAGKVFDRFRSKQRSAGANAGMREWSRRIDIGEATLVRIVKDPDHANPTLANIEALASSAGLKPWQMLAPDLNLDDPPRLDTAGTLSRDAMGVATAFDMLSLEERETMKALLRMALGPRADDTRVARFLHPAPTLFDKP